jgi:hypothetical protein
VCFVIHKPTKQADPTGNLIARTRARRVRAVSDERGPLRDFAELWRPRLEDFWSRSLVTIETEKPLPTIF